MYYEMTAVICASSVRLRFMYLKDVIDFSVKPLQPLCVGIYLTAAIFAFFLHF